MAIISVLIPAYNEAVGLHLAVREVQNHLSSTGHTAQFLLVDNGSHDGTWEVIEQLAASHPTVSGLGFWRNFGKHAALLAGLDACPCPSVISMVSDIQHPPDELP